MDTKQAPFHIYLELEDSLEEQRNKHVPGCGKADTLGGEILRAVDRVAYRYWNDGDKVDEGYGLETVNSSFRFLHDKVRMPDGTPLTPPPSWNDDKSYEEWLVDIYRVVRDYLHNTPALFEVPNYEDSRELNDEEQAAVRAWEREEMMEDEEDEW